MPTDAHFLAAIAAAPLDALPKLVYADWLDERNDPRGALVRLDAELLAVPPADDRYWHLHARREELLVGVDADWLTAVRVGRDGAPLLAHGWPDDVNGRWRTVRAAAERLLERTLGDVGRHAGRVREVERELEFSLPTSLREWIAFVIDAADPPNTRNAFLGEYTVELRRESDPDRIALSNADEFTADVPAEHLGDPDPPVVLGDPTFGPERLNAVSELALFTLLDDCHGTGGRLLSALREVEEVELLRQLAESFPPPVEISGVRVYERPGVVVRVFAEPETSRGGEQTTAHVQVSAQAAIPPADVPAFLFDVGRRGRHVGGAFVPEVFREPDRSPPGRRPRLWWHTDPGVQAYNRAVQHRDGTHRRERNPAEMVRWLHIAADFGHAGAMTKLADCYADGVGVERDPERVRAWYERASERGEKWATYRLGQAYRTGRGGLPVDHAKAVAWFQKAIAAGEEWALNDLGVQYANGHGVHQNWAEALRLYTLAAEKGDALACDNVGNIFQYGRGVPVDFAAALVWYCKGVDKGGTAAMNSLGRCYQYGKGVEKDLAEAFRYYKKSADAGNTDGMTWTGYAYEKGEGTEKDYTQSLAWYRKAADLGNRVAINNLAAQYDEGNGVEVDLAEALRLYTKAAGMGHPFAHFNIGEMYELGNGVAKDLAEALVWYRKGAELGDESSKKKLAELTATAG